MTSTPPNKKGSKFLKNTKSEGPLIEFFGWIGTICIIGAYALLSFHKIESSSLTYQLLNFIGALGLLAESLKKRIAQTVLVNAFWGLIAIFATFQIIIR